MRLFSMLALLLVALPVPSQACVGLSPPVDGPLVRSFGPTGPFSGHFGADYAAPGGTLVRAPGPGFVSFSGSVAGRLAVTVDHGGGLRTTVSSVAEHLVDRGARVWSGRPIATSGTHDGVAAVHVSVRVDGVYVDPAIVFGCVEGSPAHALRLVPVP